MMKMLIKSQVVSGFAALALSTTVSAGLIDDGTWTDWNEFANDDGHVGPGVGGQPFDAEYLLYKVQGDTLYVGLQTGFDVTDGHQVTSGENYWAGDLFLSFDNDDTTFEYAVDFGFSNCGYSYLNDQAGCDGLTPDSQGLYQVTELNNDVYSGHNSSLPFQMESGNLVDGALVDTDSGSATAGGQLSYYRTVAIDMSTLGGFDSFDAHWTMSCGNDVIEGTVASVPEPSSLILLSLGLVGLTSLRRKQ